MWDKRRISGPLIPSTAVTHLFVISFLQCGEGRDRVVTKAGVSSVLPLFPAALASQESLFSPLLAFFPLHNWHFSMTWAWQTLHSKHLVIDWVSGSRNPVYNPSLVEVGDWWSLVCVNTVQIFLSSNFFLLLHHQKLMVHISEVLSCPPGDFKFHQPLSKGQEQLIWFTARDTHFLFWWTLMQTKIPFAVNDSGKKRKVS